MREGGEHRQAARKQVAPIRHRPTIRLRRMSDRTREPKIAERIVRARKTLPAPAPGQVRLHCRKAAHFPPEAYDARLEPLRRERRAPPVPIRVGRYARGSDSRYSSRR